MPFYTFDQNNSGGGFDYDESAGISCVVIIEADSAYSANRRAEEIGLYFDGADKGSDCPCCGDRWHEAYGEGDEVPSVYDTPLPEYVPYFKWIRSGYEIFTHYSDGRIVGTHGPEVSK
jgi:hypothetical protein